MAAAGWYGSARSCKCTRCEHNRNAKRRDVHTWLRRRGIPTPSEESSDTMAAPSVNSPWARTPPDILRTIFRLVLESDGDTRDVIRVSCVCARWRLVATTDATLWSDLDFTSLAPKLTDKWLARIVGRAQGELESLVVLNAPLMSDASIELLSVAKAPALCCLDLLDCPVTGEAVVEARKGGEPLDYMRLSGIKPLQGNEEEVLKCLTQLQLLGLVDSSACLAGDGDGVCGAVVVHEDDDDGDFCETCGVFFCSEHIWPCAGCGLSLCVHCMPLH